MIPTALKDMKADHDRIEYSVPEAWANRLAILRAVDARAADAVTWQTNRTNAANLWANWSARYDQLKAAPADQPPAAGAIQELNHDSGLMNQYRTAFRSVSELLIDNGLVAVKKQLVYQLYLNANQTIDGIDAAFYSANPDETLAEFKARVKAAIRSYLHPSPAEWKAAVQYNFQANPYIHNVGALVNLTRVHWTVYQNSLGDLVNLRVTDNFQTIVSRLVPDGIGMDGVHVTAEENGANSQSNPRVYGRPGDIGRVRNLHGRNGVRDQMIVLLNHENQRLQTRLQTFVDGRNNKLQANWANR
jgi:hypothetical protein